jgi:hypothetical protein
MRRISLGALAAIAISLVVGCAGAGGAGVTAAGPTDAGATTPAADEGGAPVVLELFTSQGCSSCPPADRLLSRLGHDGASGKRVLPLAFHVDYWNYIGWTDPFSSADWSARQTEYSRRFKLDGIYTPQIVVNGRAQLVGSDEEGIAREIEAAARQPSARVTLAVDAAGGRRVVADVTAEATTALEADRLDAVVVLYESGVATDVKRGENSGRRLENDFIVRRLDRAFTFEPRAGAKREGRVSFDLDPTWNAANVRAVAFLQDPETMRIYGAAAR